MSQKFRVVVCGTRFGEHYLAALSRQSSEFELVGIVARGSQRSRLLAEKLQVPLYQQIGQLPAGIDIACVAIRSRIVGGDGSTLAEQLLQRGIAVLQEHPVHAGDIRRLQQLAQQHGTRYHVNSMYPALPAAACFIDYARQSATRQKPAFIELTTSLQLLYSSLDIIGRALGGLAPFSCTTPPLPPAGKQWPFRQMQGEMAGIPVSINLQTTLDPRDPDHHSLVMHRITVGGSGGNVCLTNSFGPVVWSHAIYAPDYQQDGVAASWLLSPEQHQQSHYNQQPTAIVFGRPQAPNLIEATRHDFPLAILTALRELMAQPQPWWQQPEWWQQHGEAWITLMRNAGAPQLSAFPPPAPPFPEPRHYAAQIVMDNPDGK
ncbi:Gfo/Idh/MocA family oxidoreductase [Winslowiella iniecta]|uniref:Siderophore synthase n=1 Tax=Winslowiella iniecta TaxID=1560201 RepID=A0A0L7SYV2_9GAMM|nr:Gfo/Idh/MocA family oxidoreductase [Winslowiella iniecta]KOC88148.1 siderophore synthase [Winslowiella iniecta]KOC88156.1 siderophore synthase [Winslowiella iniecta]